MLKNLDPPMFENLFVIEIGLKIEDMVKSANQASQGLIMTCYTSSLLSVSFLCFQTVSSLGLNDVYTYENKAEVIGVCIFTALMYLLRLHMLMNSGEILKDRIKQSKKALEDIIMSQKASCEVTEETRNTFSILRKRLDVYLFLYPIAPYSVFTLSNKTFCATIATIITYIIVLLKLKSMETSNAQTVFNLMNDTLSV